MEMAAFCCRLGAVAGKLHPRGIAWVGPVRRSRPRQGSKRRYGGPHANLGSDLPSNPLTRWATSALNADGRELRRWFGGIAQRSHLEQLGVRTCAGRL